MIISYLIVFVILSIIFAYWALSTSPAQKTFKGEYVEEYFIQRTCDKNLSKKLTKILESSGKLSIFAEAIRSDDIKIQRYNDLQEQIKLENNGSANK